MRGAYWVHRKELLVQEQISRLPETMPAVERYTSKLRLQAQNRLLWKELGLARNHLAELQRAWALRTAHRKLMVPEPMSSVDEEKHRKAEHAAKDSIGLLETAMDTIDRDLITLENGGQVGGPSRQPEVKSEKPKVAMPCGNTKCRGFLAAQKTKCELCEHHTCDKCLEHLGLVVPEEATAPHVCKPENIKSAEFVRKRSKPCPCCSARISKIDGCDQMWCTQCRKAFSWNTGLLVSGPIHNPHFYQYQREHGGVPRNPGDVVCGGIPDIAAIFRKMQQAALCVHSPLAKTISSIRQFHDHFEQTYTAGIRRDMDATRLNRSLEYKRIYYILNMRTREDLADEVAKQDYKRKKATAIINICQLLSTVSGDIFRLIIASEKTGDAFEAEMAQRVVEFNTLRLYVNDQMKEISMTYGICVQQISANWGNSTSKFKTNGETAQYILDRDERQRKKRERIAETIRVQGEEKLRLQQEQAGRA